MKSTSGLRFVLWSALVVTCVSEREVPGNSDDPPTGEIPGSRSPGAPGEGGEGGEGFGGAVQGGGLPQQPTSPPYIGDGPNTLPASSPPRSD
jgi:hypothetical protein